MNMSLWIAVILLFFSLGCSGGYQSSDSTNSPATDYFANKAKWESAKKSISKYSLETSESGMTGWQQIVLEVDIATDAIVFCSLRSGEWGKPESIVESDCMTSTSYHKRVEDYFDDLESLISSDTVSRYQFDPFCGVPVLALGKEPDVLSCADCVIPGFEIRIKILQ